MTTSASIRLQRQRTDGREKETKERKLSANDAGALIDPENISTQTHIYAHPHMRKKGKEDRERERERGGEREREGYCYDRNKKRGNTHVDKKGVMNRIHEQLT